MQETQCDRGIATHVSRQAGYFGRVTKNPTKTDRESSSSRSHLALQQEGIAGHLKLVILKPVDLRNLRLEPDPGKKCGSDSEYVPWSENAKKIKRNCRKCEHPMPIGFLSRLVLGDRHFFEGGGRGGDLSTKQNDAKKFIRTLANTCDDKIYWEGAFGPKHHAVMSCRYLGGVHLVLQWLCIRKAC